MTKSAKKLKKVMLRSSIRAVVKPYGRDSYKYFERSRYTIVEGEVTGGCEGVDRIVFRYCPMKWSDNKVHLNSSERKSALSAVGKFLNEKKILWKFSNFGRESLTKTKLKR
jgi:hypothetical protein